ncbi:hypothetical protein MHBO_003527, partial [Bonamia ostreae]
YNQNTRKIAMTSINHKTRFYDLPPVIQTIFNKFDNFVQKQTETRKEIDALLQSSENQKIDYQNLKKRLEKAESRRQKSAALLNVLSNQVTENIKVASNTLTEVNSIDPQIGADNKFDDFFEQKMKFYEEEILKIKKLLSEKEKFGSFPEVLTAKDLARILKMHKESTNALESSVEAMKLKIKF